MAKSQPEKNNDQDALISKSQLKREMHHLQDLGKALIDLKAEEIEKLSITEVLIDALNEAKRIKHREGLRRQMQFIGKLMRKEPTETIEKIEAYFDKLRNQHQNNTQHLHLIEQWRDRLLNKENSEIEALVAQYPNADRQWLRQMVRQSWHETDKNKPPAAARKLFIYIRELINDD
ncbi:MAG: ribosome biogenesis factor YjgA [Pseudomonadales bacterium]|nr:ribosome biogenesis factor YjgA [Pseudomonadales bacterium]